MNYEIYPWEGVTVTYGIKTILDTWLYKPYRLLFTVGSESSHPA